MVVWSHTDSGGAASVGRFHAHLLHASRHPLAKVARSPLARQHMLIERWAELASQGGGRIVGQVDFGSSSLQRKVCPRWAYELPADFPITFRQHEFHASGRIYCGLTNVFRNWKRPTVFWLNKHATIVDDELSESDVSAKGVLGVDLSANRVHGRIQVNIPELSGGRILEDLCELALQFRNLRVSEALPLQFCLASFSRIGLCGRSSGRLRGSLQLQPALLGFLRNLLLRLSTSR